MGILNEIGWLFGKTVTSDDPPLVYAWKHEADTPFKAFYKLKTGHSWPDSGDELPGGWGGWFTELSEVTAAWMDHLADEARK